MIRNYNKKPAGFTLIELAVVMIVIGLLIASFSPLLSLQIKQTRIDHNKAMMSEIISAMSNYRSLNGHYPCPASLTAQRGDVDYGHKTANCNDTSVAVGSCAPGGDYCVKQGMGTVVKDPATGANITINPRVRVGAIPFRELNLPDENYMRDAYGNLFTYALTEDLGESASFDGTHGGIGILNDQGQTAINPVNSAHFAIISSGPDGDGAYLPNGTRAPCSTGLQNNNCSSSPNAVFRSAQYNGISGANHFDDVLSYSMESDLPLWEKVDPTSLNIHHKQKGDVGVSYGAANVTLDNNTVKGDVRAADGVKSLQICNKKGEDCFYSSSIGGNLNEPGGGMKCPAGYYMTGIDKGQPVCVEANMAMIASCDPGFYMTGINSDGTPVCKELVKGCDPTITSVCNTSYTLPAGKNGATTTISAGTSFKQKFTCTKSVWVPKKNGSSGSCTCNVETDTQNAPCDEGFSGRVPQTRTSICPSGDWGPWVNDNGTTGTGGTAGTCVCQNTKRTQTLDCDEMGYGAGYSGVVTQESVHDCTTPAGSWGPWVTKKDTCKCEPYTDSEDIKCTGNLTGTQHRERQYQCPDGNFTPWVTTGTCSCTPKTESKDFNECPSGQEGVVTKEHTLSCPNGTWGPWTVTGNTCKPIPPATCRWKAPGGGLSSSVRVGAAAGATCSCGTPTGNCYEPGGGGTFLNMSGCTCE